MAWEHLEVEHAGDGVSVLWLNRPDKLNALHRALWDDIPAAVAQLDTDPETRVIVLAGRGKAFCAGIDLVDHAPALAAAEPHLRSPSSSPQSVGSNSSPPSMPRSSKSTVKSSVDVQ